MEQACCKVENRELFSKTSGNGTPLVGHVFAVVGSFFLEDTGNRKDVLRVEAFWLEQGESNSKA